MCDMTSHSALSISTNKLSLLSATSEHQIRPRNRSMEFGASFHLSFRHPLAPFSASPSSSSAVSFTSLFPGLIHSFQLSPIFLLFSLCLPLSPPLPLHQRGPSKSRLSDTHLSPSLLAFLQDRGTSDGTIDRCEYTVQD